MSAPVPPPSRGLVTLDELRTTMHRMEQRLAITEDLLRALVKERAAAAAPAPAAPPRVTTVARYPAYTRDRRRARYAAEWEAGAAAAREGLAVETCPLTGTRGVAGSRRLAWREGWTEVMLAP